MLNRRIIRGKVLQQIFAYKACVAANTELAQEKIIDRFKPDLNSLEPQDAKKLEGLSKLSLITFEEFVRFEIESFDTLPPEAIQCVQETILYYKTANNHDKLRIIKRMVEDGEKIFEYYLLVLTMLQEIAKKLYDVRKIDRLLKNEIITFLDDHQEFNKEVIKRKLRWVDDQDIVNEVVSHVLQDEETKAYLKSVVSDPEGDRKIALYILRSIIFKNPHVNDFFEGKNINWEEDRIAVKDMAADTIKGISPDKDFMLSSISKNWEDDKDFMKTLFSLTIENDRAYEALISPKLKNWDISRLTSTDSIIMKMCVSEMINFHSVPLKVSLNEYIELSKRYSTPKSKTLINGVIDNLSQELVQNGVIKKSGRGLMDNK